MTIQPSNSPTQPASPENVGLSMTAKRRVELSVLPVTKWTDDEILYHVSTQYQVATDYIRPKRRVWADYTKLYLNQFRKEQQPDSLGSKIVFTKFHEAYAHYASDEKTVEFEARALDDYDVTANLNRVAEFDWQDFDGPTVWNSWLWDTLFYSYGILDLCDYDRKRQIIKPRTESPYIFYFDPLAPHLQQGRFCGRFVYFTYWDMLNHPDLDEEKVKLMATGNSSLLQVSGNEQTQLQQDAKNILVGANQYEEPVMAGQYFELVEHYIKNAGKTFKIYTDKNFGKVLGVTELKNNDSPFVKGDSLFPFIIKSFYKLPRSIPGSGIPDIVEDDHRSSVRLVNYMQTGVMQDATPTFLYNFKALMNPRDMRTREIGKNIPLNMAPNGEVIPFPKTGAVTDSTLAFLSMLENRADLALGRITPGSDKTATAAAISKTRQDLLASARSKEMMEADVDFWYMYLARYRKYMKANSAKLVRILGESGYKELREFKKSDFIPGTDPDIKVVSKLVSEPKKIVQRRDLTELIEPLSAVGGNAREAVKQVLYLLDMRKDDITNLLPPTPHEIRASDENDLIAEKKVPLIHESDDDVVHIVVHQRAEDNEYRAAHIQAHVLNYLRKANLQPVTAEGKGPKSGKTPAMPAMPGNVMPAVGAGSPDLPPVETGGAPEREMIQKILGGAAQDGVS